MPYWYDLFTAQDGNGYIRLFPIPSGEETFKIDYYRRMVLPCSVTSTGASWASGGTIVTGTSAQNFKGVTIGSLAQSVTGSANTPDGKVNSVISRISSFTEFVVESAHSAAGSGANVIVGGDNVLLDCPEDYAEGIVAWATHHYLINKAASPRLEYWAAYAREELDRAIRENAQDTPDQESCFIPAYMHDNPYLGPNDIRWADYNW